MKFRHVLGGLSGLVAAGLAALVLLAPTIEVAVPEARVNSAIAEDLPKPVEKLGVDITIETLDVDFLAENAVHVFARAKVSGYGQNGEAEISGTSGIAYRKGSFFLEGLSVKHISFAQDEASIEAASDFGEIAKGLWARAKSGLVDGNPAAGPALERVREQIEAKLRAEAPAALEAFVQTVPVYSLDNKNFKHDVAALALESIRFEDEAAIVVLSPGQVILKSLAGLALAAMIVLFAAGVFFSGGAGLGAGIAGGLLGD